MFKKKRVKTHYDKNTLRNTKSGKKGTVLKFFIYLVVFFLLIGFLLVIVLYNKYIKPLPGVKELENLNIAESSTIFDRDGNELYKVYKENRTYIDYNQINKNMINALVAGEDKRYWTNPGIDIIGLMRATLYFAIGKNDKLEGTSTLSQQLIRNTILTNERKIERKIKELYLSYMMTKELSKEKILELYLNKISFGSNAFGIEQASKTFFAKNASELGVLESSILASLPKGPSYYSPYSRADRLLGYPYFYTDIESEEEEKIITQKDLIINATEVKKLEAIILGLETKEITEGKTLLCGLNKVDFSANLRIDNDGCIIIEYPKLLNILNAINIKLEEKTLSYQTGRKDFILQRMLEDKYITFDEYKSAIINSFGYTFNKSPEKIDAPHFVFYVREYLEEKYGKEILESGGLKIYTTLDPKLQEEAERLVEKHGKVNEEKFAAKNAALISLDNETGEILAMVGGRDYFDQENGGNNNMITAKLQPGSTFKPFVYSMGIYNNPIGTKSPIYDLETKFPGYTPANFDGKFMGKMNISTALNNSRNIPAVKMFSLAGGETEIVKFMKTIGVDSLENHGNYGAPLALGTGEMTPLELATAYSVFANMGVKKDIVPIIKIEDSKGNIIEEITENKGEKVISEAQAYIINHMLSDTSTRPEFWNSYLSIPGRVVSAKTGTSTKQYTRRGVKDIYPRNLWTIGYTPQITTVAWAGNTDGEKLDYKGNGLEGAGPIWRDFMVFAHKGEVAKNWKQPSLVKEVNISEISGLLPSPETSGSNFVIKSLFINKPEEFDNSLIPIKVDALCNGKVTEDTPKAAIRTVSLVQFHSLIPERASWEDPVREWVKLGEYSEKYGNIPNIITKLSDSICERDDISGEIEIATTIKKGDVFIQGSNYVEIAYRSSRTIKKIDILIGDKLVDEIYIGNKKKGGYGGIIKIPTTYLGEQELIIRVVDTMFFSEEKKISITVTDKDRTPPEIEITNPIDLSIKLYKGEFFNLRGKVTDRTKINNINIYIDGKPHKIGIKDRDFVYPIYGDEIDLGIHTLTVEAIDSNFNISEEDIKLEVIEK